MFQLLILALLGVYVWGAVKFLQKADRYYESGKALPLALAWPALLLASPDFRRNFSRSLKP
jgi:hypothetical protein